MVSLYGREYLGYGLATVIELLGLLDPFGGILTTQGLVGGHGPSGSIAHSFPTAILAQCYVSGGPSARLSVLTPAIRCAELSLPGEYRS